MTFKGKPVDVKAIGKDLGVRYVLEGSVQPSGDRMRVNAQLIDAGSGAHLWAEQFDTPRADLLQTQDAIVTHLANTLDLQLMQAVRRTRSNGRPPPIATPRTWLCNAPRGMWKAGHIGKEADAAYALCEQALAIDPNNVRALMALGVKFYLPAALGLSSDPKGDLERADQLESKALALDPDWTWPHDLKGSILRAQGRYRGSRRRTRARARPGPVQHGRRRRAGLRLPLLGEFDKSLEYFDKAILGSPYDPALAYWYDGKAEDNFGLKRYDQAIELARQAIAINPNYVQWRMWPLWRRSP